MGRHGTKLTAAFVRSVRQAGLYSDEHGLVLRVNPFDYKQWVQRLFIHGKRRELGLDPVCLMTLAETQRMYAFPRIGRKRLDRIVSADVMGVLLPRSAFYGEADSMHRITPFVQMKQKPLQIRFGRP